MIGTIVMIVIIIKSYKNDMVSYINNNDNCNNASDNTGKNKIDWWRW